MKLHELFEDENKEIAPLVHAAGQIKRGNVSVQGKNIEILGGGVEAVAYRTNDNPNVIKVLGGREEMGEIPYVQYILALSKYAKENPYFPRVYSKPSVVKISPSEYVAVKQKIASEEGVDSASFYAPKVAYIFKMEPLIPLTDISEEELQAIWDKMFVPEKTDVRPYQIADRVKYVLTQSHPSYVKDIKDPLLLKALQLVKKIKTKMPGTFYDLHTGNMMVRRTPYGPQLVITDPLFR